MIDIEKLEKEVTRAKRITEEEHELKIVDVRYEPDCLYVDKETGKQSSGKRVILTVEIGDGDDSGNRFNVFYNLDHPSWSRAASASYLKLLKAVFPERSDLLENSKDPNNLLHRSFKAYTFYKPNNDFVNIKDERPLSDPALKRRKMKEILDEDVPF